METFHPIKTSDYALLPDTEVVERVLEGEKELYELLMRRHNQKLYRAVRSYLKAEHEVEDAMQDTYLKAYEKLRQFRNNARFSTWLIRIGINTALEKIREHKRVTPVNLQVDSQNIYANLPTQVNTMNPEKIALQKEAKQLLEKAIDFVPEKYRIVYTLRELEGMDVEEVTQCLGLSESNVKIRLHRAKSMLKEILYKLSNSKDVFEFGFKRCDAIVERVMHRLPS
ncbi:MAG: RNA polymerase sigma factor [Hymenobacteraceae bacterium]|mgnify:CR=1 FL=1|nr:RNA polymerase sigma factor [Hymenobacteraceae bacterium]